MTYKLWHNGTEYGPYTRQEIAERHGRGELNGILWRRVGDGDYKPHTELNEELAIAAPAKPRTIPIREHAGGSLLGGVFICIGIVWGLYALVTRTTSGDYHNIGLISDREINALAAIACIIIGCTLEISAWLRRIAKNIAKE